MASAEGAGFWDASKGGMNVLGVARKSKEDTRVAGGEAEGFVEVAGASTAGSSAVTVLSVAGIGDQQVWRGPLWRTERRDQSWEETRRKRLVQRRLRRGKCPR